MWVWGVVEDLRDGVVVEGHGEIVLWARRSVVSESRPWTPFRAMRLANQLFRLMTLLSVS